MSHHNFGSLPECKICMKDEEITGQVLSKFKNKNKNWKSDKIWKMF
jgi:hypothetical protein